MKIKKYDVLAVLVVGAAILIAGAIEFSIENYSEELPVTDSECEQHYGFSVEDAMEPGLTEGWGKEGNSLYLKDMNQGHGK